MQKLDNKFKHILPVILLLLLITIIIGVTYAVYTLTTIGNENSITTGLVSMSYTESTNVIDIKNALPMSDAEGKTQSNYFDFSVTSNLTLGENDIDTPVYYSIELEPLSIDTGYNALQDNQIKIYLEDLTNNKVLLNSKLISNLSNYKLYNTNHTHKYNTNSITTNYRIRAWIDYSVDASNWSSSNKYEYKFRINVNSNIDYLKGPAPEYCFVLSDQDDTTMTAYIYKYNCGILGPPPSSNIADNNSLEMLPNISKTNDTSLYSLENIVYPEITDVVIPSTINGYKIIGIGTDAFYNNNLTSVTIPDSVTTIGNSAFYYNKLTSVTIPDSVTTIGNDAFSNNNLTSVTIPDSITTIGDRAFSSNNLTSVTIPDSVTTIDGYAFYRNNLTSVTIPNSVTYIGYYAFSYNNLTSVTIPNSVTTIGGEAFSYNNLQYVLINEGSNLTSIEYNAFFTQGYSHTLTIYNNSGKSFRWYYITQYRNDSDSYSFVTGSIPSYTSGSRSYGPVEVTTGTPS